MRIEERAGILTIVDFDRIEAYKIARAIEREGIRFYRALKSRFGGKKAGETLSFLIQQEEEHLRFFEKALFRMRETGDEMFEEDGLLESMEYGLFSFHGTGTDPGKMVDDPERALELGLVIEERSIAFYESCRKEVREEETRAELSRIIEEENRHKNLLEGILT